MKSTLCFVLTAILWLGTSAQTLSAQDTSDSKATISGYLYDLESGEKLIGANIYVSALEAGTTSNVYGFYSLTIPTGVYTLRISYIGYETQFVEVALNADVEMNIGLDAAGEELAEIEVVADRTEESVESSRMGTVAMPVAQIKALPALLGEVDVLKAMQLLPGVQSGSEGSSGLYVRGGGPDQNLILLDGAPVYNASHLFGFFSVFNADAIRNVQLVKGGFPARYGGRLSSVLDINMKEGNLNEFHGEGSISVVASKLSLEGPIKKGKTSFIVSGRRTYLDLLIRPIIARQSDSDDTGGYYFYDLNTKVNHIFSNKHRLFFSLYGGNDRFYFRFSDEFETSSLREENKSSGGLKWGNVTSTLRWNWLINNTLFANTTLLASNYRFLIQAEEETRTTTGTETEIDRFLLKYNSGIRDYSAKVDLDWIPSPDHYVKMGIATTRHRFSPGAFQAKIEEENVVDLDTLITPSGTIYAQESSVYLEDDVKIGRRVKVNVGVHTSMFNVEGKSYASLEPRISGRFLLNSRSSIKLSGVRMTQYLHLLSNSGVGLPTDLWLPSTKRVKPQESYQFAAGYSRMFGEKDYNVTIEGYYKSMRNLIEYEEGANFLSLNEDWQDNIEIGKGNSYGIEFLVRKNTGSSTGWIGYTLSRSEREFENLNFGNPFPYRYDRRHDISVVYNQKWTENRDFSITWVFGTGSALTLPVGAFIAPADGIPNLLDGGGIRSVDLLEERNSFRMANYHRLDAALNFRKEKRRGERVFTIGVYNTYNRRNPFFVNFGDVSEVDASGNITERAVLRQVSLFPIIPSLTFRRSF